LKDLQFLEIESKKIGLKIILEKCDLMAYNQENFELFRETLFGFDSALDGIRMNIAVDDDGKSFWVLRMKVREKIVADGIEDPGFDINKTGRYLKAAEYNELAERPDTIIVDMRNHYEYEVGHFKNAIEVPSDTFRDQLPMAVDMLQDHHTLHLDAQKTPVRVQVWCQ